MDKGGPQVEAMLPGGPEDVHPQEVHQEAQAGDDHQGFAADLPGLEKPVQGGIEDIAGHGPQDQAVDQGHQNLQAAVTEGLAGRGPPLCPAQGQEAEPQGRHVAEHMAGVRQQGQAAAQNPSHQLHHEKGRLGPEGQAQAGLAAVEPLAVGGGRAGIHPLSRRISRIW